jgi:APA family basic amino acid/polyamine antiporter
VADFILITIGSVIGSGIFRTPAVVAQRAYAPALITLCWIAGGVLALIGAFVFAELAARRPLDGGLYAYLREAYGRGTGFVFVWMTFWVVYTGGTAASAALFSGYLGSAFGVHADPRLVACTALAFVTAINVLGVRQGAGWQNLLVALKVSAIVALAVAGFIAHPIAASARALPQFASPVQLAGALGIAMLPALFAYNGFQSPTFISAEVRNPAHTITRGLLTGVCIVIVIYIMVSTGCLRVLGAAGLAASTTPAAEVMQAAFGSIGSRAIALAIALSTLGYMSTAILLAPRVYFELARDGMLFGQVAYVHPRTRVPIVAIVLHGTMAAALAVSGTFEQIVNWVTLPAWGFIALAAFAIFIFRKRDRAIPPPHVRVPGHPWTTLLLIAAVLGVFIAEIAIYPRDSLYSGIVLLAGVAVYAAFMRRKKAAAAS